MDAPCEACRPEPVEHAKFQDDELQPYRHTELLMRSLRPLEWYNLAAIRAG